MALQWRSGRTWLEMLFTMQRTLDELATETLRCKLEAEYNQILLTLNNCRNCSSLHYLGNYTLSKTPQLKEWIE